MRYLFKQLAETADPVRGTILVIGAGNGSDLPQLRQLQGSRLVLVEAHPGQAETLSRQADPALGEEVWPLAMMGADAAESTTLHVLNNPHHSSIRTPAMQEYFPNLRVVRDATVPARSLDDSIEQLALVTQASHLLVLDAPGIAFDLLASTKAVNLQAFARIVVNSTLEPLYVGEKPLPDLIDILQKLGFDAGAEDPEGIHPQAAMLFERNELRVLHQQFESRLALERAQASEQARRLGDQHHALQEQLGMAHRTITEQKGQIEQLVTRRDNLTGELAAQRAALQAAEQGLAEHAQAQAQARIDIADQQRLIEQLVVRRDNLMGEMTTQSAALQAAEQALAEHAQAQSLARSETDALALQCAELDKQVVDQKALLEAATSEAAARESLVLQLIQRRDDLTNKLSVQSAQMGEAARGHELEIATQRETVDRITRENHQHLTRISELEAAQLDLGKRQHKLNEEMIKAEAQVDLIKDILLREPGF